MQCRSTCHCCSSGQRHMCEPSVITRRPSRPEGIRASRHSTIILTFYLPLVSIPDWLTSSARLS